MTAVILAWGAGTRISGATHPKPRVATGGKALPWPILQTGSGHGSNGRRACRHQGCRLASKEGRTLGKA